MDSELSRAGSKYGLNQLAQQQQIVLCSECHDKLINSLVKAQSAQPAVGSNKLKSTGKSEQLPKISSRKSPKKSSSKYSNRHPSFSSEKYSSQESEKSIADDESNNFSLSSGQQKQQPVKLKALPSSSRKSSESARRSTSRQRQLESRLKSQSSEKKQASGFLSGKNDKMSNSERRNKLLKGGSSKQRSQSASRAKPSEKKYYSDSMSS